jgi:hypothetical protein
LDAASFPAVSPAVAFGSPTMWFVMGKRYAVAGPGGNHAYSRLIEQKPGFRH